MSGAAVRFASRDWPLRLIARATAFLVRILTPWTAQPTTSEAPSSPSARPADPPNGGASDEEARAPLFDGYPYLLSVLSRGIVNHMPLPETMTENELIELTRFQLTVNHVEGCLVLGPRRAVYFQPDGSARFLPAAPRPWFVELDVFKPPFEFEATDNLSKRQLLAYAQQKVLRQRVRSGWGDVEQAGEEITAEEAASLRGVNSDGSPRGLTRCGTCGEYRGRCLDPHRPDHLWLLPVYCSCENVNRCAYCGHQLYERRLDGNYYRPQDGLLIYVPGIVAAKHECPPRPEYHLIAGLPGKYWTVN